MKGSMRRRGESWELRVYAGLDPVSGKHRYVQRTVKGGKREAQRALAAFVAEVGQGDVISTDATVSDLLDRWWMTASADWSATTRRQNESAIAHHVRSDLGSVRLAKLTAADLDRWYADLRRKPGRRGQTLAASTIVRVAGVLRSALTQAVKWGWIPRNPASSSTMPKVRRAELSPPDVEAMAAMLRHVRVKDPTLHTYLQVAATTGARRSQICGLQWRDIDISARRVTFARAVVDGDKGIEVKGTKTDREYRVALDDATAQELADHAARCVARLDVLKVRLKGSAFVFSYEVDGSKPWRPDGVTHRWTRYRREIGLEAVRLHDVRHFMATTMLSAGVPVSVVASRLGHSRAATTLNVYSHFVDGGDQDAADMLSGLIASAEATADGTSGIDGHLMGNGGLETKEAPRCDGA
ncbi:MAG: site-specific integrase [bacterium]|nr:site-specific integrase [bacterium]